MQGLIRATIISLGLFAPALHAEEAPKTTFTVGVGVGVLPEYSGSDDLRFAVRPVIDYQHESGFFASTVRGLGYQTKSGPFKVSAAIGMEGARYDRDRTGRSGSDELAGMGEIRSTVTANLAGSYEFENGMTLGAKAMMALNHRDNGNRYQFGMTAPLLKTDKHQLRMFAVADYADRKYMQTYHGVTAQQSAQSHFAQYKAKAGFEKVTVGLNHNYQINEKWSLNSTVGAMTLVGDAADSPLTKRKSSPMVLTSLNYKF